MKSAKKLLNNILCICLLIFVTNCTTPVTPDIIESDIVSYDEYGNQTSGIISVSNDKTGFIVTKHFINRYNDMIKHYSDKFSPKLEKNQGVKEIENTQYYFITNQAMAYFLTLNDLRRMDTRATLKD